MQHCRYAAAKREHDLHQRLNGKGSKSCTSYGVPAEGAGVAPGEGALDRRVISAAVVNCRDQGIAGRKTGVTVVRWIETLSWWSLPMRGPGGRTANNELYIEVIEETGSEIA